MNSLERQLGLIGFGFEISDQSLGKEREKRIRLVSAGEVIYLALDSELGYTVLEPFDVIKLVKPEFYEGMEKVKIESDRAILYRDGKRVGWRKGTAILVNTSRIINE